MSRYIGPWIVRKRWWMPPWGQFIAITLYPFVILTPGWSAETLRHELVHVHQVRRDGWFRFYFGYVWLWLRGVRYRDLPAELEAHDHEDDSDFLPWELELLVRADVA